MTEIYPSIENPNFNYIIANHPDFKILNLLLIAIV